MLRVEGQPAFVLHARAYRETSLLLECLTRDHGRIGLVARGVRRERTRLPRGLLQPFQLLALAWSGGGELATLIQADAAAAPLSFAGDVLLAAIYVNELIVRLSGRGDPHQQLFETYATCLERMRSDASLAWALRRFERDLLAELGYGLKLTHTADSDEDVVAEAAYSYDADAGPSRVAPTKAGAPAQISPTVSGGALLALAEDRLPDPDKLAELRRLMRRIIRQRLGGGILNSWNLSLRTLDRDAAQ
ncbi:MAG: DNA repair protein RecO [Dokdonella sp.]